MRVTLRGAAVLLAAVVAVSVRSVDGVANCADCPSGKTCLLEDKSFTMGAGQNSLPLKFCNFDAAKREQYTITFSLKKPLACDPENSLMPAVASLSPQDGCAAANCVVTAALKAPVDWALLLKNDADANVLQAKLEGSDEAVQIAQGGTDAGASAITGGLNSSATVCSTKFAVQAARLSARATCNKVTLCRGKPADTGCTTPVKLTTSADLLVDDVTCAAETCMGTIAIDDGLPCDAASSDGNALLVSIKVGNSGGSGYASIATVSVAPAATISSASVASVGSTEVTIKSDATCAVKSLNVTVDGLALKGFAPANGTILISLASALTDKQAGSDLALSVSQCGVVSNAFSVAVVESGSDATTGTGAVNKASSSTSSGSDVGDVSPTGTQMTQTQNASTGLPHGLYIGIGVGVLALLGFGFECWYHRRRHHKEHGTGNGGGNAA